MGKQFHAGAIKLEPGLFFWFQFWILPERPLLHPLDKRNGGSGDEIGFGSDLLEVCSWLSVFWGRLGFASRAQHQITLRLSFLVRSYPRGKACVFVGFPWKHFCHLICPWFFEHWIFSGYLFPLFLPDGRVNYSVLGEFFFQAFSGWLIRFFFFCCRIAITIFFAALLCLPVDEFFLRLHFYCGRVYILCIIYNEFFS